MRLHGDRECDDRHVYRKDGSEALFTGGDNEIWSYGDENFEILKKYILLREAMRPYIRTLMQEAHELGRPLMRPMFYEFPEQENCWDLKEQYMFGSSMLVAPVVCENADQKEVYLPYGHTWTLLHNGEIYEGGVTVEVHAPLEIIPVFLKDDSLKELIGCL